MNLDDLLKLHPMSETIITYPRRVGTGFVWPWFLGGQHHGRSTHILIDTEEYRRGCIEFPARLPITLHSIEQFLDGRRPTERYLTRRVGNYVVWVHEHHAHEIIAGSYVDMRWDEEWPTRWPNLSLCECTHDPERY